MFEPAQDPRPPAALTLGSKRVRIGAAPISWGACEVPGWGPMPDTEQTLREMSELGLLGTELGAPGFLPREPESVKRVLALHRLQLIGAFVPLVLHEREMSATVQAARENAELVAGAGGEVLAIAAVLDADWSAPRPLTDDEWQRLGEHCSEIGELLTGYGLGAALHPHAGTVIETAGQVQRALEVTEIGWCLDSGHLLIGGGDPASFARDHGDRVAHVHLKDVDRALARELAGGRISLLEATKRGLFTPLGQGAARIAAVLDGLQLHGYGGWIVLEQDTAITVDEPAVGSGPISDARRSIEFLHNSAQRSEEVN
jgi:inosose dehydratase